MASGILVVDKPEGWTSHDVVAKVRRLFGERRVGHSGTLDPMATGVLPVFLGRATRAVSFAVDSEKEYIAGLQLGVITDTQDTTGTILETRPVSVGRKELEALLPQFRGEQMQRPPMYSAIKQNGKKLYELARAGQEVERAPRPVTFYTLELLEGEGQSQWGPVFTLRVRCSKGTYVRTLCHDIGQALGCGGAMCALRRTHAAGFGLEQAVTMETLMEAEDRAAFLLPVDTCFQQYPALTASRQEERKIHNGMAYPCQAEEKRYRVYGPEGGFLMLGEVHQGRMETVKSFFEV
ncbi:MAG: tRNA pseudouridine(55) synthase TruB [Oscillospiraceae bacterium]|nr:tRNA pseudouridine(55) synthase TruB [Oscillospiraceae bacterium]